MTTDKAIETLEAINQDYLATLTGGDVQAIKLGIEALNRVKEQSINPKFGRYKPLPGETES